MKKLLFAGALALSTFTFASIKEEAKPEAKHETTSAVKELTQEQKEALALFFRTWSVVYTNA